MPQGLSVVTVTLSQKSITLDAWFKTSKDLLAKEKQEDYKLSEGNQSTKRDG